MDACTIKGVPTAPQRLGTPLTDLYVELRDQHQNSWCNRLVPKVTFTSSNNKLSLSSQAGVWETTDPGQHRLRLPAVTVMPDKLPPNAFATNSGSASVSCTVSFSDNVTDRFILVVLPGKLSFDTMYLIMHCDTTAISEQTCVGYKLLLQVLPACVGLSLDLCVMQGQELASCCRTAAEDAA